MLVVAGAFGFGAAAFVSILRTRLTDAVDQTAINRVNDVVALQNIPNSLSFPGDTDTFIQVVSTTGTVLSRTENAEDSPAVSLQKATPQVQVFTVGRLGNGASEPFRVAAVSATISGEAVFVFAGESLKPTDSTVSAVTRDLLIALPFLVGLVGLIAWRTTKRALRPVHQITAQVSSIGESDLSRRVPAAAVDDEIGELATTMNAMLARVEQAMSRQRRFVADASHELRSPLTSLRTQIEVASTDPAGVTMREAEPDLLAELDRLDHLVRDLLGMARIDARATVVTAFDLSSSVRKAMSQRRSTAQVVHRVDVPTSPVIVLGVADHLTRAVGNLVDNADRHAVGRVDVSLHVDHDQAVIEVVDDGSGIPVDKREYVFERFTRLDDARATDDGGSGLGLAIVRDIISMHGGTIAATDGTIAPMTGARMVIRLPLDHTPIDDAGTLAGVLTSERRGAAAG